MIELLTIISLASGALLFILLLASIIGGLDLDFDLDVDLDGGLGILKSTLTFLSVGAWVVRLMLHTYENPTIAFVAGTAAGIIGVFIVSRMFKFMLSQEINVNYQPQDALLKQGKVYVPIPSGGEGVINVAVKGTNRELKAKSINGEALTTGTLVEVVDLDPDGIMVVQPISA
ncbi:hypothetical protein [Lewinella sp. 4G2]|uniref:hypothetical protein n=1 Tax=Lewinella sp. 4G2 TaxID=1803372 RepID=UPI0007B49325|nr:hypothetical protein [Lewinella sp. 4G2]OAV46085.1 hypothetical protein A3850_017635 [Lewinella sp. 4G2]